MPLTRRVLLIVRNLFGRRRLDEDLSNELESYLELLVINKLESGMLPEEARRSAIMELGGIEQLKEQVRASRSGFGVESFLADLRYAGRALLKKPAFSVTAALTLALGIGATTSIFTIVRGVLLKSLPFSDSDRLVAVGEAEASGPLTAVPYRNYLDWRTQQHVFDDLAARLPAGGILTGMREPERVFGRFVSASFFPTLGIPPQLGRFFTDAEDKMGAERVIVISDALWRRYFDTDPTIVGRVVEYNAANWTIIGVMPRVFDFYGKSNENNDFFIPLGQLEQNDTRGRGYPVRITARLKSGVSIRKARAEMHTLARRSALQYPQTDSGKSIDVRPLIADYVGDTTNALIILSVGVIFLLLIACANVANLTLARAISRRRELALRLALGATRLRIIRLLLTESILLALVGAGIGVASGFWAVDVFKKVAPSSIPCLEDIYVDAWVLAVTLCVAVGSGVLCGLTPALRISHLNLEAGLKESSRQSGSGAASRRFHHLLVVTEIALSLMLLIGAGLLSRSFMQMMAAEPGFDSHNVLSFRLRLADMKYPNPDQAIGVLRETHRRLQSLPGVTNVAITTGFPLRRSTETSYWLEGEPVPKNAAQWPLSLSFAVNEKYHSTLGIPVVAGRQFTDQDRADTPPVLIVDDEFVTRNYPNGPVSSAIGRRLKFEGANEPWREIVGVVRHVKQTGLDEQPRPEIYRPWTQINVARAGEWLRAMDILIKTKSDPEALVPTIRREIQQIDPDQPLGSVELLGTLLDESIAPRRGSLMLIGIFSVAALALSTIGLYGVMTYVVGQRRQEIGVRMALGATRTDILRIVLGDGMLLTFCGIGLGIIGSFALSGLMRSMLFGVAPTDAVTIAGASGILSIIALVATYLPARNATYVNPVVALRCQ